MSGAREARSNVLYLMSDQHNAGFMGCSGHPLAKTPNLDALAERGTLFEAAYTPSPICVSARAAFATGRHCHTIGAWDNVHPYTGVPMGWAHRVRDAGYGCVSVGKLHYRSEADDTGFDQIVPLHVVDGIGDLKSLLRDPLPPGKRRSKLVERIGPGETAYTKYDQEIVGEARKWLMNEGSQAEKPWALFVSLYCPHHPYSAPQEYFDLYDPDKIELPDRGGELHPWVQALNKTRNDDTFFDDDKRRLAIANYLGLCSFMDDNVGQVLAALDDAGLTDTTRVAYMSDHGESLGARRIWQKFNLYEEASRIPLIVAGPGIPKGKRSRTPVSLIDASVSVIDAIGVDGMDQDTANGAQSIWQMAVEADDPQRVVFSEYHGSASPSGAFMLRRWPYKLIYYVGFLPELFDLEADPEERNDLSTQVTHKLVVAELEAELRKICDPEEVDRKAKADQEAKIEQHGGREALEMRGWLQGTPPPGVAPEPMD